MAGDAGYSVVVNNDGFVIGFRSSCRERVVVSGAIYALKNRKIWPKIRYRLFDFSYEPYR